MLVNIRCLWVCLDENVLHLKKRGLWNFSDMSSFVGEPAGMSPLHLCEPTYTSQFDTQTQSLPGP